MDGSLKVKAPVLGEGPPHTEHLHAAPDPADADQALIHNTPFFLTYLNFGDIVRVGEGEDSRPILEVVPTRAGTGTSRSPAPRTPRV